MSVSIAEAIREAAQTLRQGGVPDARREAGSLLQHVIERDRTFIITHAEDLITPRSSSRDFANALREGLKASRYSTSLGARLSLVWILKSRKMF